MATKPERSMETVSNSWLRILRFHRILLWKIALRISAIY
jgi:hypothetical protein